MSTRTPRPTIPEPRETLLNGVLAFVREASAVRGVLRIALIGSLTTGKAVPKDADVLVTVAEDVDMPELAMLGRRLKGRSQRINLGADIFLAGPAGNHIGRICRHREPHFRVACKFRCGQVRFVCDDSENMTLAASLIREPPIDLWPKVIRRIAVPPDVERVLLSALEDSPAG